MVDVGYAGGGDPEEPVMVRCYSTTLYFIKWKIVPAPGQSNGPPTALGGGSSRSATGLGSSTPPPPKIQIEMRRKYLCRCISGPEIDHDDWSGFSVDDIDPKCDSDGFRECRASKTTLVGFCDPPLTGANPCNCNQTVECSVEVPLVGKFFDSVQFADGAPLEGPVLDNVKKAFEALQACDCNPQRLEEANEVWFTPTNDCAACLGTTLLGCDQKDKELMRMALNSSNIGSFVRTDLAGASLCSGEMPPALEPCPPDYPTDPEIDYGVSEWLLNTLSCGPLRRHMGLPW